MYIVHNQSSFKNILENVNTFHQLPAAKVSPLIPKIALFIPPSSCYTFPCKLVTRIWFYIKKIIRPDKFE